MRITEARSLQQLGGIPAISFPQSDSRTIPASERLYDAVVHERLVHPDDAELNSHVHGAVAKQSRRGWRLDRAERSSKIDGVIALAMTVERQAYKPEPVQFLGRRELAELPRADNVTRARRLRRPRCC